MPIMEDPEICALVAYRAYQLAVVQEDPEAPEPLPLHELEPSVQAGWLNATRVVWEMAKTGSTSF